MKGERCRAGQDREVWKEVIGKCVDKDRRCGSWKRAAAMTHSALDESKRSSLIYRTRAQNILPLPLSLPHERQRLAPILDLLPDTHPQHTIAGNRLWKEVHTTQSPFPPTRAPQDCMEPSHPPPQSQPTCAKLTNRHNMDETCFPQLSSLIKANTDCIWNLFLYYSLSYIGMLYTAEDASVGFRSRLQQSDECRQGWSIF